MHIMEAKKKNLCMALFSYELSSLSRMDMEIVLPNKEETVLN